MIYLPNIPLRGRLLRFSLIGNTIVHTKKYGYSVFIFLNSMLHPMVILKISIHEVPLLLSQYFKIKYVK